MLYQTADVAEITMASQTHVDVDDVLPAFVVHLVKVDSSEDLINLSSCVRGLKVERTVAHSFAQQLKRVRFRPKARIEGSMASEEGPERINKDCDGVGVWRSLMSSSY